MNNNNNKRKIFDGKYEIFSIVGRGQSSVVYHAKLLDEDKDVAIKVLVDKQNGDTGNAKNRELLRKESLSLVSCRHNNVVKLEDFQALDKICYLVMEYAKFGDIQKFLNGELLDYERGEGYLLKLLEGLDFIHKVGFIHRDICPENMLVFENDVIKLGDFGQGEVIYELNNAKQLKIGIEKNDFVAPEYFTNDNVSFNADIYSLGASFFYLFTHSKSFNVDLIKNKKISYCLKKMLNPNPIERFETAAQVLDFLNARNPINVEASRRLTRDHLEDIENIEKEFENFDNLVKKNSGNDAIQKNNKNVNNQKVNNSKKENRKIDTIIDNKDEYKFNKNDEVIDNNNKVKEIENTYVRDVTKMTLKEINQEKLQELERERNKKNNSKGLKVNDIVSANSNLKSSKNISNSDASDLGTFKPVLQSKVEIKKKLFLLLLFIFAILLLLFSLGVFDSNSIFGRKNNKEDIRVGKFDNIKLSFPNLENGVYEGTLEKVLYPSLPFMITVNDGNFIFQVKEEGFMPVMFDNNNNSGTMEVRFNGVILVLKPVTISKNLITGNLVNKVTGEKGTWSLKRVL